MPPETEAASVELDTIEEPTVTTPGLFGTGDPRLVIARAVEVADELARVIRDKRLSVRISGREHVFVEGWTLLGTMLGVFPVLSWSRPLDDGWEARVEARTLDGRIVGAAESMCLRSEKEWGPKPTRGKAKDEFALRSMAATRATSKALRQPLGFVMSLAGFEVTPAEEMPAEETDAAPAPSSVAPVQATDEQFAEISALLERLTELDPDTDWTAQARELAGVPAQKLTRGGAGYLIDKLRALLREHDV
jgi:hypothetical protein